MHVTRLPISFRIISMALGQSYDCPSAIDITLKDMGKTELHEAITKHNKARTVYKIIRMYLPSLL